MKTKYNLIVFALILSITACLGRRNISGSAKGLTDSLCFLNTGGTLQKDSTAIRMTIKNGSVIGDYVWYPEGKDARVGTISGTLSRDTIRALWTYIQEGSRNSKNVKFYFDSTNNRLVQRGRYTDSLVFTRVDCSKIPYRLKNKSL